jgi:TIR domain
LSFSGERRDFVAEVARLLAERLGKAKVFYDKFHEAELARPDLDLYLSQIYRHQSDLVVPFYSADFERKKWCQLEWRQMRDIIFNIEAHRIMPFRFDEAPIDGVLSIDGYLTIENRSPQDVAELILRRLDKILSTNPDAEGRASLAPPPRPQQPEVSPENRARTGHSPIDPSAVAPHEPRSDAVVLSPGWLLKPALLLAICFMLFSLPQQIAIARNIVSEPAKTFAEKLSASKDIWVAFPAQFAVVGMLWLGLRRWATSRRSAGTASTGTAHAPVHSRPDPELRGFIPSLEDALFGGLAGGVLGGCIIAISYWHIENSAASLMPAPEWRLLRISAAKSMLVHILWFAPLASTIWSVSNQLALSWVLGQRRALDKFSFWRNEILGSAAGGAVGACLAGAIGGPLFPWINSAAGFANLNALVPGIAAAGLCILLCPLFYSYRGFGKSVARSNAFLFGIILTAVIITYLVDLKRLSDYLEWLFTTGATPVNVIWGGIILAVVPGAIFGTINGITLFLRGTRI